MHTLYYGGEANRENDAQQTTLNDYGVFSFSAHTNTANRSSAAITDFLFGSPNTMGQDVPVYANANYFNYGIFFQDDWRALPNLTLNLGIRYDIQTTPTNTLNMTMNFVPNKTSTIAPNGHKGVLFPGDPGVPQRRLSTRAMTTSPRVSASPGRLIQMVVRSSMRRRVSSMARSAETSSPIRPTASLFPVAPRSRTSFTSAIPTRPTPRTSATATPSASPAA